MPENMIEVYSDVAKFEQAVEEADDSNLGLSQELKGTPQGCTVRDLVESGEAHAEASIIVSKRTSFPLPVGASFTVKSLHEAVDLIETFGTWCIEDLEKHDGGIAKIGYHFD